MIIDKPPFTYSSLYVYPLNTQIPPASLIFFSAFLEKCLALTTTGRLGRLPPPKTLKIPDLVQSIIGALSVLLLYL
uniref:Uncharacterized protein n=1 Tax=Cryptosporidium parvum TaxID=5807 RepID=F0X546_CRYPV